MSAFSSLQIRTGKSERPSRRKIRIFARLRVLHDVVIGQDVKARQPFAPDDHPRPGLLELPRPAPLLGPDGLLGDDVHDRRARRTWRPARTSDRPGWNLLVLPGPGRRRPPRRLLRAWDAAFDAASEASAAWPPTREVPATWAETGGPPRARTIPSSTPALSEVNERMIAEDRDSINGTPGQQRFIAPERAAGAANVPSSSDVRPSSTRYYTARGEAKSKIVDSAIEFRVDRSESSREETRQEREAGGSDPAVRQGFGGRRSAGRSAGFAEIHLEIAQIDLRVALAFLGGLVIDLGPSLGVGLHRLSTGRPARSRAGSRCSYWCKAGR